MAMPIATPDDRREREAGEQSDERVEHVVRQDARGGEAHEGGGHLLQRRKQLARKDAELRGDLPEQRHHQERERGAGDDPQPAFAARRRGPGSEDAGRCGGRQVGHRLTIVPEHPSWTSMGCRK